MKRPLIVVYLFTAMALGACKQRYRPTTSGEVKATFVMSDTMLHRITVDTAVCTPVVNVIQLRGKVATVKKAQAMIVADIPPADLSHVKQGMTVMVYAATTPQHIYDGHISNINARTAQVSVRLQPEEPVLEAGMTTTLQVRWADTNHMVAIPAQAVIYDKRKRKSFVMVFRDRYNIDKRQVWTFKSLDNTSYISGGLDEGEKVVSTEQQLIYNAMDR